MKTFYLWIFIIIIALIISATIFCICLNIKTKVVSDNIILAFIGALTAIITIVGSIYVNQQLSVDNARQQREMEIRKIKQEYYHKFTESFMLKIAYLPKPDSDEYKSADKYFCLERNRLPLYASQELIEWVDSVARGTIPNADFTVLYDMIRKDLCNNDFKEFNNLKEISVTLPKIE